MKKPSFVKGSYGWSAGKGKIHGRERCVVYINKGGKTVGHVYHHPAAKQLTFEGITASTKPLLEYVMPILEKKRFYFLIKLDKLFKEQEKEKRNG